VARGVARRGASPRSGKMSGKFNILKGNNRSSVKNNILII
jgi:hypothetical protein